MNPRTKLTLTASLLIWTYSEAGAQQATTVPPSVRRGMFSSTPVGIFVDSGSGDDLLITDPGSMESTPRPWSYSRFGPADVDFPDYSLDAMFGPLAGAIELTGVSSGNDLMPAVLPDGTMVMNNQWYTLTVSVTNAALGQPGSHAARVASGGVDTPGSELYTYYVIDSVGIAAALINTNHSERSREQLGLGSASPPAARADVAGIDIGMGVIAFDQARRSVEMFPTRDRFYFTVAQDCVGSLGPDFAIDPLLPNGSNTVPADSATIYELTWLFAGGAGWWTQPVIYRRPSDLGLNPDLDQIDAITVSPAQGSVVFSTQPVYGRNQLLVQQGLSMTPQPLRASNGMTVTQHLGVTEDDDIDGTCGIDPKFKANPTGAIGQAQIAFEASPLGLSISRYEEGEDAGDRILVQVTGLSQQAKTSVSLFRADGQAALAESPLANASTWKFLGKKISEPKQGTLSWTLPANALGYEAGFYVQSIELQSGKDAGKGAKIRGSWVTTLDLVW